MLKKSPIDLLTNEPLVSISWQPIASGLSTTAKIEYFGYQEQFKVCVLVINEAEGLCVYSGKNPKKLNKTLLKNAYFDFQNQKYRVLLPEGELVYSLNRAGMSTLKNLNLNQYLTIKKEPI
ncbi:MAG: hypothetical protein WCG01_01770 [bacterium]